MDKIRDNLAGLCLTPLRWICGWIFFAAAWRRLVLKPESLDPHSPLYEGIKLNHFLPDALFTGSSLKYVILHPEITQLFLYSFTGVELILGIALFLGLGVRLFSLVMLVLFINLLLTVGWLGTTCLDEWTVASMGIGFSLCLFLGGAGPYSLDAFLANRYPRFTQSFLINWIFAFRVHVTAAYARLTLVIAAVGLLIALASNQYFVGGVYGPFHNPAVQPHLELKADVTADHRLELWLYRNQGPDTYGAFITDIRVYDSEKKLVKHFDKMYLAGLPEQDIANDYLVKVMPNQHALVVPLGASATLTLPFDDERCDKTACTVEVSDISGLSWQGSTELEIQ